MADKATLCPQFEEAAERRAKQIGDRHRDPNWWNYLYAAVLELRAKAQELKP